MTQHNTSSSITSAFTFEDVIKIFAGIDNKIISLHNCSSEDFLGLNRQFRQFHSESKTISDNAQKVLDIITRDKSLEALRNLQILKEQLKSQMQQVDLFLSGTGNIINGSVSGLDRIVFTLRNLRQNITTIKFLFTSLNLEASCTNGNDNRNEHDLSTLFSGLEAIIKGIHVNERAFLLIKEILTDNLSSLSLITDQNSQALEQSFQNISKKINKLVDIRQSALLAIPRLKQITEECRHNVSQIITNLQYHDIIKQKIDHIQLTHRNLVSELDAMKNEGKESSMRHSHAKIFMKIRDIAGLQAAQLIHANKSYQNAIREITGSLKETGESMAGISQLCSQFVSQPEMFDILHEKDLQVRLENLSEQVNNDRDQIEDLAASTTKALGKLKEVKKNLPDLQANCSRLFKEILRINDSYSSAGEQDSDHAVTQVRIQVSDSEELLRGLEGQIEMESRNLFSVHKTQLSFIAGRTGYLDKLCSTTDNLLSSGGKNIAQQLGSLQGHIKEGSNITRSIRKSIDQVKYYDFFEKVIEEIIAELNGINFRLKFLDAGQTGISVEKNLEHLKNQYTMASEHRIHDSYSGNKDVLEETELIQTGNESPEDEENLELF